MLLPGLIYRRVDMKHMSACAAVERVLNQNANVMLVPMLLYGMETPALFAAKSNAPLDTEGFCTLLRIDNLFPENDFTPLAYSLLIASVNLISGELLRISKS
jgi:hypothetical protein